MTGTVRLVLFDLDGTLIDAYDAVYRSVEHVTGSLGYPQVEHTTIKRNVGWGDRHLLSCFIDAKDLDEAVTLFRAHHDDSLRNYSSLLPGALDILMGLKGSGILLAVASNRPSKFSNILLEHLGIKKFFDYIVCGDEVENPKPHPDILVAALEKLMVAPSEAVYIGDMFVDAQAGQAAGVRTIIVTTGSSTKEEVIEYQPFRIVSTLEECRAILQGM